MSKTRPGINRCCDNKTCTVIIRCWSFLATRLRQTKRVRCRLRHARYGTRLLCFIRILKIPKYTSSLLLCDVLFRRKVFRQRWPEVYACTTSRTGCELDLHTPRTLETDPCATLIPSLLFNYAAPVKPFTPLPPTSPSRSVRRNIII